MKDIGNVFWPESLRPTARGRVHAADGTVILNRSTIAFMLAGALGRTVIPDPYGSKACWWVGLAAALSMGIWGFVHYRNCDSDDGPRGGPPTPTGTDEMSTLGGVD